MAVIGTVLLSLLYVQCSPTTRPAAVWWSLLLWRWPGRLCWQGWGSVGWSCCRPCRCGSLGRTDTAPQSHSAASWPVCRGGVTTKKHISHHSYRLKRKTFLFVGCERGVQVIQWLIKRRCEKGLEFVPCVGTIGHTFQMLCAVSLSVKVERRHLLDVLWAPSQCAGPVQHASTVCNETTTTIKDTTHFHIHELTVYHVLFFIQT